MLGKNYAGTLGVDGWAPYRCFGSDATDLLQPSAAPLPRATGDRPRAGRCASHAWSRPSSGTPSPCANGAMLARSARMACALPRDSSRTKDEPPAARPIHQSCQPAIRETSATAIGTTSLCSSTVRTSRPPTIPPNKTFASPWSTARPARGGNCCTAKGAQAQSILMSVLQSCRHKGIRVIASSRQSFVLPTTPPSPWSTQSQLPNILTLRQSRASIGIPGSVLGRFGSPGWTRTNNLRINSPSLHQLSYRGMRAAIIARDFYVVLVKSCKTSLATALSVSKTPIPSSEAAIASSTGSLLRPSFAFISSTGSALGKSRLFS